MEFGAGRALEGASKQPGAASMEIAGADGVNGSNRLSCGGLDACGAPVHGEHPVGVSIEVGVRLRRREPDDY